VRTPTGSAASGAPGTWTTQVTNASPVVLNRLLLSKDIGIKGTSVGESEVKLALALDHFLSARSVGEALLRCLVIETITNRKTVPIIVTRTTGGLICVRAATAIEVQRVTDTIEL